jgi:hypothetical protein
MVTCKTVGQKRICKTLKRSKQQIHLPCYINSFLGTYIRHEEPSYLVEYQHYNIILIVECHCTLKFSCSKGIVQNCP